VSFPSAVIPFVKASACGNDFLLIDAAILKGGMDAAALTRRICDRHEGVGADGAEWMYPSFDKALSNQPYFAVCKRNA